MAKRINFEITGEYIGLSSDTKPTTGVEDGSTFICVDTGDCYMFYNGTWYKQ